MGNTTDTLPPHSPHSGRSEAIDVLESLSATVLVVDTEGRISYRNEAARQHFSAGDQVADVLGGLRFGDDFRGWHQELENTRRTGRRGQWTAISHADASSGDQAASRPTYRVHLAKLRDAPQRVVIQIAQTHPSAGVDADDHSELARRLTSLGKMAARVAHELNNPLDGILRYINMALRLSANAPEPRIAAYLNESRTGLLRMIEIIGDLLEYSRATAGAFDEVGINELVEQAIRGLSDRAAAAGVVVTVDFQSAQMPTVSGGRLYQVCCNLIKNAIDAMPEGGRLAVTTGLVEGQVVIRVSDTGIGLPQPPEKVFEPFYTTKTPGKGTGLGLAICKDFIEDMGGTISAERGQPKGSVFTVRVPVPQRVAARKANLSRRGSVVK
jgi:signal transduction histidine kinase